VLVLPSDEAASVPAGQGTRPARSTAVDSPSREKQGTFPVRQAPRTASVSSKLEYSLQLFDWPVNSYQMFGRPVVLIPKFYHPVIRISNFDRHKCRHFVFCVALSTLCHIRSVHCTHYTVQFDVNVSLLVPYSSEILKVVKSKIYS
jgi:hypothetical protein